MDAYATTDIVDEYQGVVRRIIERGVGTFDGSGFIRFIADLNLIESFTEVSVCRDPDDNKFISCAVDGKCLYIVSGDDDLLSVGNYGDVEILTVAEFLSRLDD